MDNNINFGDLQVKASATQQFTLAEAKAQLTNIKVFEAPIGTFFLINDIFAFPPMEVAKIILDTFKGHDMALGNIAKNAKLDWRPIKAFLRTDSLDQAGFLERCSIEAKRLGYKDLNSDLVGLDIPSVMEFLAGKTVKVIARIPAKLPKEFVKNADGNLTVKNYKDTTLPVFAIIDWCAQKGYS